ncbi:MAG: PEGA domain-containing protein [Opitutus sp.]
MSSAPLFFFEQTDFSLRFARCADAQRPLRIDELKEVPLDGAAALIASLPANAVVFCAVRPKSRALHLSTADEAKPYVGLDGIRKFVELTSTSGRANTWFAAAQARDGAVPHEGTWLLSTSSDAQPQIGGSLETLKLKPVRCASAAIATAGALARTAVNSVLLVEIGELASHALLVGRDGMAAAGGVSLDLNAIGDAIQNELGLKFRGSAVKLFFNPEYDFTEIGSKIAARLAPAIKGDLDRLVANQTPPASVLFSGLAITQQWLGQQLALALGIPLHVPDLKAWSASTGVTFSTAEIGSSPAAVWYGLVDFVNAATRTKPPAASSWVAEWLPVAALEPAAAATPIVSPPVTQPVSAAPAAAIKTAPPLQDVRRTAAPMPAPSAVAATATAPAFAAPSATVPAPNAVTSAPIPTASTTAPTGQTAAPSAAKYSTKSATNIFGLDPAEAAKKPATTAKTGTAPKLVEPPKAPAAPKPLVTAAMAKVSAPVVLKPFTPEPLKPMRKKRSPVKLALIGAIAVAVLIGGYLLIESQNQVTSQLTLEKQQAEQRLRTEQQKARAAEKKAHEEAESRKKTESELSQKLVDAEAARQQAEAEAVAQTAARLAAARGSLVIATNPAGATIKVGNLPPRTSPFTFSDLKIGTYAVTISLPHYEEMKLDLVVNENATTDTGVLSLNRLVGGLKISSEPGTATYELSPANQLMVAPESRRSGSTPATLDDLTAGDYNVTITRDGWSPHSQIVSIARNATTVLRWEWPNGLVKITSTPTAATVLKDGTVIGVTPLSIPDQPAGEVRYTVTLDHYDPVPLVARIEAGHTAELSAQFRPEDRFYTLEEVDRKPDAISARQPELPYYLTLENGRVELELTVGRDGATKNVTVVQASNPELGKFCAAAVSKWQYRPGTKSGSSVNVKLKVPFVFKAAK